MHASLKAYQQFALNLPAQFEDSKQNGLHCDSTSVGFSHFGQPQLIIRTTCCQTRLLQSAVSSLGCLLYPYRAYPALPYHYTLLVVIQMHNILKKPTSERSSSGCISLQPGPTEGTFSAGLLVTSGSVGPTPNPPPASPLGSPG